MSPPTTQHKGLKDTQSFFSLKKNKTMRLQRWGAWIAYEDQETNSIYWYNQSTTKGQWETPPEVAVLQAQQQAHKAAEPHAPPGGLTSEGDMKVRYFSCSIVPSLCCYVDPEAQAVDAAEEGGGLDPLHHGGRTTVLLQ